MRNGVGKKKHNRAQIRYEMQFKSWQVAKVSFAKAAAALIHRAKRAAVTFLQNPTRHPTEHFKGMTKIPFYFRTLENTSPAITNLWSFRQWARY